SPVRYATAGVGSTPTRTTVAPALARPATTAASSISPLARGSRPTTAIGACDSEARTWAAATATAIASSGVRSPLARPRTPSVPKRRAIQVLQSRRWSWPGVVGYTPGHGSRYRPERLTLRVLRRLAGLLQTVLLAFLHAGVARQEAGLLERRPVLEVQLDQGP